LGQFWFLKPAKERKVGRDGSVRTATPYGPVGVRFSAIVQTGPGYWISASGIKGPKRSVEHPPPRNSEVKRNRRAIPTLLGLHGSLHGTLIKSVDLMAICISIFNMIYHNRMDSTKGKLCFHFTFEDREELSLVKTEAPNSIRKQDTTSETMIYV
jgi:hypothetical protein